MGEMKHRTANLAAVITAIASQSRPKDSPATDRFVESLLGRIRTLLATGELVVDSSTRMPDLAKVIRSALEPFLGSPAAPRIAIEGPSLIVSEQLAGGLALAFHELATNAIKYGALSCEAGTVLLSWSVCDAAGGKRIAIEWRERGGPAIMAPERHGYGTRVIRAALSSAKNGTVDLDFARDGLRARFSFEIPA
jgi:two-component sensor histidine kinase